MKEYWIAVREFFGVAQPEIIVVSSLIIGQDVISFDDVPKERYATRANRIRMVTLRQFAERTHTENYRRLQSPATGFGRTGRMFLPER